MTILWRVVPDGPEGAEASAGVSPLSRLEEYRLTTPSRLSYDPRR
jgi:hypothetical protein